jgi:hypothetical protein
MRKVLLHMRPCFILEELKSPQTLECANSFHKTYLSIDNMWARSHIDHCIQNSADHQLLSDSKSTMGDDKYCAYPYLHISDFTHHENLSY